MNLGNGGEGFCLFLLKSWFDRVISTHLVRSFDRQHFLSVFIYKTDCISTKCIILLAFVSQLVNNAGYWLKQNAAGS